MPLIGTLLRALVAATATLSAVITMLGATSRDHDLQVVATDDDVREYKASLAAVIDDDARYTGCPKSPAACAAEAEALLPYAIAAMRTTGADIAALHTG